ncbi:MAG: nucleoside triphosphate pyrophosphohydrolase [archaeon]|nr:nucleoside triphosphate pyrophosphohydrolase [archaeon]
MGKEIERLIDIVSRLRSPKGCPWDREQTHKSLLSSLLDETYEFFEAAELDNPQMMKEELGDILLQVILHAQIANESKSFTIEDVASSICEKLIRRHPHVFGNEKLNSSKEVLANWEKIKKSEKGNKDRKYIVDGIPDNLPALFRAEKIQRRVSRVGFDWKEAGPIFDKVIEEFNEFKEAIQKGDNEHATEELGDILFSLVNVARYYEICAEDALRLTTKKFNKRFRYIEDKLKKLNISFKDTTLDELDTYWEESKKDR